MREKGKEMTYSGLNPKLKQLANKREDDSLDLLPQAEEDKLVEKIDKKRAEIKLAFGVTPDWPKFSPKHQPYKASEACQRQPKKDDSSHN